jgi:hypothetical protein
MPWIVASGTDNGDPVIVSITDDFREPASREGRATRVSVRFMGGYMLQSAENREAFEDAMAPFLAEHGGVLVAGITRTQPVSYTFHFYCRSQNVDPEIVPVDAELKSICTVSVHDDPEWHEYQSWLPAKMGPLQKLGGIFKLAGLALRGSFGPKK